MTSSPDPSFERVCFRLQVRPEKVAEYRERHQSVPPRMLRALESCGWNNYSLFMSDDGLVVGYLETADFAAATRAMAETGVDAEWQAEMDEYFVEPADPLTGRQFDRLREVFNLEAQLDDS